MADAGGVSGATAGSRLREARLAQGLHLSALAAAIKIPPTKLELLEADRIDELPDPAFARALALTVCRALKIDAEPVLALLPQSPAQQLERVSGGLNAPFRGGAGLAQANGGLSMRHPAVWAPLLILLAAVAVYLVPAEVVPVDGAPGGELAIEPVTQTPAAPPEPAAEAVVFAPAPEPTASPVSPVSPPEVVEAVHAAPDASVAAASEPATPPPEVPLQLSTSAESWVEVRDARGEALLSRVLQPGETVSLDGAVPLRVRIGNAAQTEVSWRGEKLDLGPVTRNNIARLELP